LIVGEKFAAMRFDPETAELDDRRRVGGLRHEPPL
jgi:hypothetical protein